MQARLNRLFAADGRCLDVAVDHGFFGEPSFLAGIEDMEHAIATLAEAGPDAIQLSRGQAPLLQRIPGPGKPALVLRTDIANVYGREGVEPRVSLERAGRERSRAGGRTRRRVRRRERPPSARSAGARAGLRPERVTPTREL